MRYLLLTSVFVIATCGLIYELVAGTLASYILGDSVTQFSTIIGAYLFAMGIGSFLSKYITKNLVTVFIRIELLIGVVGGTGAAFLFSIFDLVDAFRVLLYAQVALTGIMVGLEIPLLMRILKDKFEFKDLVSQIFTFDYIGALLASLLFPLILIPYLGLVRTSLLFGILNIVVALWAIYVFRDEVIGRGWLVGMAVIILFGLTGGMIAGEKLVKISENRQFPGKVIYATSTPYQRMVLARKRDDLRLYLNGNLQFSSRDEYRYHEALVHPGLASIREPKNALVLGGGDGLAVREILKYPGIDSVLLVDLDPEMTKLFKSHPSLTALNQNSLHDPKVRVINADAFQWIRGNQTSFDFICIDFPDPSNFSLGKLYSLTFYEELHRILAPGGRAVVQSTSPFVARKSYWCVAHTLRAAGLSTEGYHTYLPSFGEWGFLLAGKTPFSPPQSYPEDTKFVSPETFTHMQHFPPDMAETEVDVNRLNNQALVRYFEKEWSKW